MGIRFYCPECGRRMNVKSFLAGKRGICPHCDARWDVPLESQIPEGAPKIRPTTEPNAAQGLAASPASATTAEAEDESTAPSSISAADDRQVPSFAAAAPSSQDPIDAAPEAVWYVRPASGGEFGPARGDVMRRWLEEGRVGPDSMVWCEGWPDWQIAGPIFPDLAPATQSSPQLPVEPAAEVRVGSEPKTLANLESIQKKTVESNGRVARHRSAGKGKSIAAVVILGLMIVSLFIVLIVVVQT